jgi:hypothetical protein
VPASYLATAGLAPVKVKAVDGVSSTAMNFSIASATITGFNPSYAMVGGSAFALTVNGTGFGAGATVKVWNGTAFASVATAFVSATQLTASISAITIPATAGPLPIEVVNGDGTTSVASNFPIIDAIAPTIASVSPSSIVAGAPASSITVKGVNFVAGTGTGSSFVPGSLVNLGGVAVAVITGTTTQIVATLPLQAGTGTLNLTVLNGTEVSQPIPIVVVGPTILSVSPNSIAAGTNGTSITVTGTNFVPGTSAGTTVKTFSNNSNVYLNGSGSPLTATAVTSTSITATVLAASMNAVGTLSLVVQNPGGAATSAIAVPIGAPTITSLSPASAGAGTVASGSTLAVTVNGTNFVTGGSNPSKVYWAGTGQTTTYVSSSKLTVAILGSLLAATPSQIVTVQNGSVASSGTTFNVSGESVFRPRRKRYLHAHRQWRELCQQLSGVVRWNGLDHAFCQGQPTHGNGREHFVRDGDRIAGSHRGERRRDLYSGEFRGRPDHRNAKSGFSPRWKRPLHHHRHWHELCQCLPSGVGWNATDD